MKCMIVAVCCSVLQYTFRWFAVCCSVLQCVAVLGFPTCARMKMRSVNNITLHFKCSIQFCCSVLQHAATYCVCCEADMEAHDFAHATGCTRVAVCCNTLQYSVLQHTTTSTMFAVCCSVVQCCATHYNDDVNDNVFSNTLQQHYCCNALQCGAVCCNTLHNNATRLMR